MASASAKVSGGYYWNTRSWEVEVVPSEGGALKDPEGAKYVKVPFPALFVVVPVAGAVFLMTLPAIGFALVGSALVKKIAAGLGRNAEELASTVVPGSFAAGESHFTGKAEEERKAGAPVAKASPELEKLESEIADRKAEKK